MDLDIDRSDSCGLISIAGFTQQVLMPNSDLVPAYLGNFLTVCWHLLFKSDSHLMSAFTPALTCLHLKQPTSINAIWLPT